LVFSEIHFRRQRERANDVELKNHGDATTFRANSTKGKGGRVTVLDLSAVAAMIGLFGAISGAPN
jgi:hypothetical protein